MFRGAVTKCSLVPKGPVVSMSRRTSSAITPARTHQLMHGIIEGDSESFPTYERDFVDRRRIAFRSGSGGNPAPNTTRGQKTTGPAFGGHGGSLILRGNSALESLTVLPDRDSISADAGSDGLGFSRGIHASDRVVDLPLGTIVRERVKTDKKTAEGRTIYAPRFLYQFLDHDDSMVLCKGGRGGVAPLTFKKADGRVGEEGEKRSIDLELRLVNDCALIGLPNSGKTSIISSLTSSLTRIGPEPYSTTRPHLGTLRYRDGLEIKLVDLPGIVEGDSTDKARGIRILRHMWRSKLLLYCIDVASESIDPMDQLELLRKEVKQFDNKYQRKELIVATKCDMLHMDSLVKLDSLFFRARARIDDQLVVVGTSARFGLGISRLVSEMRSQLYPSAVGFARPRTEFEDAKNLFPVHADRNSRSIDT